MNTTRIIAADRKVTPAGDPPWLSIAGGSGGGWGPAGPGIRTHIVAEILPCWLFTAFATSFAGVGIDRWLMVFDAATLPPNGTPPDMPAVKVPNELTGYIDISLAVPMSKGIVLAASTDGKTLTLPTDAEFQFFAGWKVRA